MCGIYASISTQRFQTPSNLLKELLRNRGPDHTGELLARVDGHKNGTSYWISLFSTVLGLRGGHTVAQPFVDAFNNSTLCWNGEAWKIGLNPVSGNDGQAVFDLLIKASSKQTSSVDSTAAILHVLRSISGPFAFVFLDAYHNQLYFGRDRLGRRSLLYKSDENTNIQLSSIADDISGGWLEVEADAVYRLSLDDKQNENGNHEQSRIPFTTIHRHLWIDEDEPFSVSPALRIKELSKKP
jgi:asparagine synthetase B (glutamine-hydrolysing)